MTIFLGGCKEIDKLQAEDIAMQFVNKNVKFFARDENSTLNLPQFEVDKVNVHKEDKNWVVVMHVSSKAGNLSKEKNLTLKMSGKGDIIEFDGKPINVKSTLKK
jgi:hypothetical protein